MYDSTSPMTTPDAETVPTKIKIKRETRILFLQY